MTDERETLGSVRKHPPLEGYRILVVDDDEDVRTFLLALFADSGAQICEAADGDEAIRVACDRRPDLITLDLSMPGVDGIEAFVKLRSNPATGEIPVCIITGHPEFRKVIYDSSVAPPEGFISKPCDPEHVVETVHRIVGLQQRKKRRREHSPASP